MYLLNNNQVGIIISDVENARITLSHLADELIDHICCEVERQMSDGKSFEDAYELVKGQTGIKVLQKIQESTQYLIDKKYRRMKMTMKITGNVSLAILGLSTIMKLFHWPGASILMMIGFVILCLVFFPAAIYANYKEVKIKASKVLHLSILIGGILFMFGVLFKVQHLVGSTNLLIVGWVILLFIFLPTLLYVKLGEAKSTKEKSIAIVGTLGLIIFELSTMFKVLHYPGASILMIFGSILLVTIFLPMFTYSKFKETGKITGQFIFLTIGSMFFILFSILLALNISGDILSIISNEGKNSAKIITYLDTKNQKLYDGFNAKPFDTKSKYEGKVGAIQNQSKLLCDMIESIKVELIKAIDQVDKKTAVELTHNINRIANKTDIVNINRLMLGENGDGYAYGLKQNIIKFKEVVTKALSSNQELNDGIAFLLSTSENPPSENNQSWEQFTFRNNAAISSITVLMDIEKRVKMAESQAIQYINTQN
jgi:hypothetical protein